MSKLLVNARLAVFVLVCVFLSFSALAEETVKSEPSPNPPTAEPAKTQDPAPASENEVAPPPPPSLSAESPTEYLGTYKSGSAPLKEKTRVKLLVSSSSFEALPVRKGMESWRVPVQKIRGATPVEKGVWLYWFADGGAVEQAYIEMNQDKDAFASALNKSVKDYYSQPLQAVDKLKSSYETYKDKALKEAQ